MSLRVPKHQKGEKPTKRGPRHTQVATNIKTEPEPTPEPAPAPSEPKAEQPPSE